VASMASKLVHVVVFTPKEGEEKGTAKFVDGLRGLSGMGSNKFLLAGSGMSIDSREKGEDGHYKRSTRAALVSEFDDEAGLASYATSPEHVEVVETLVKPTLAGPPVAVDYLTGVGNTADLGAASVVHVVLFKVSEKAPTADFAEACNSLQALDTLEGVVSVSMGSNIPACTRNAGFTHCFVAILDTRLSLEEYLAHPQQTAAAKGMMPLCDEWLACDFACK